MGRYRRDRDPASRCAMMWRWRRTPARCRPVTIADHVRLNVLRGAHARRRRRGRLAGLRAAEAVRKAGFTGEIIVACEEPRMPYNRPPLSKDAIGTKFARARCRSASRRPPPTWSGDSAPGGDRRRPRRAHRHAADGTRLGWDGLVAATGVRSRRLTLPGPEAGRHAIRTLDDLEGLRNDLDRARRIVVIGGGFIGCEVAAAAVKRGLEVTVVEPEPLPMLRPLGAGLAAALLRRHEARGVVFRLGVLPASFDGDSRAESVLLSDGHVPADLVVESVGSVLNTEWLDGNGLDLAQRRADRRPVRVVYHDDAGRDDVIAVGDMARFPHPLFGGLAQRAEHWTVATDTARHAGGGAGPSPVWRRSRRRRPVHRGTERSGATSTRCASSPLA